MTFGNVPKDGSYNALQVSRATTTQKLTGGTLFLTDLPTELANDVLLINSNSNEVRKYPALY